VQLLSLRVVPSYHPFSHTNTHRDLGAADANTTPY
jgi:hypothetical protein